MKPVKAVVIMSVVSTLMTASAFADGLGLPPGRFNASITMTGRRESVSGDSIDQEKFVNTDLMDAVCSNADKNSHIVLDTTADAFLAVDDCGIAVCATNTVATLSDWTCTGTTTKGSAHEKVCQIVFTTPAGASGNLLCDFKWVDGTKSNLTAKCAGAGLTQDGDPAQIAIKISGVFKPSNTCPP